jgi:DNA modification methylase
VVTSPPYCVGINYGEHDDGMAYPEYLDWIQNVFCHMYDVMKDHSYVAINIGRNSEHNTPAHYAKALENAGFKFYKSIVWVKPQGAATQVCWYKYPHPRYYVPYLVTEDILIYTKGEVMGEFRGEKMDILSKEFIKKVASNMWEIQPETGKVQKGIHPAPFPPEVPSRLIQLLSLPGDVVYDPFAGSGTTLLVARELGRHFIGTDIDPEYVKYVEDSLRVQELL